MSKIFCIGSNKTGTTSLTSALSMLGYNICPEEIMYIQGSVYFENFRDFNYDNILNLVNLYDVFEDRPWNHTDFYKVLNITYPNAKFILTTRNVQEWWDSYIRWDNKVGLRNMWHYNLNSRVCYGIDSFLDNSELSKQVYLKRNDEIRKYFSNKSNFLEIDINQENIMEKICFFLQKQSPNHSFPHLNKTL